MKVTIVGCHAATPTVTGNPTAQVLEINNQMVLIDCGEGTQKALRQLKIKFSRLNHIFISHLHGDHVLGLVGLISTFSLLKRERELHIYGPKGIKDFITLQLKLTKSWTNFQLICHELESKTSEIIFENEYFSVATIPLKHRIYCNGFLFREQPKDLKLNLASVLNYNIDKAYYKSITKGKDITLDDGTVILNHLLTTPADNPKSYAFCSDTAYNAEMIKQLNRVTVLYHESTFLENHKDLAKLTKHSTAKDAAHIASAAKVNQLILGHFSSRYTNTALFLEEAKQVFFNTSIAEDSKVFEF